MFVGITNTPRDYAWGSSSAIAELLGTEPSGGPEAELWLGAHAGSPSRILDPSSVGGARTLADWIAADPATALGPVANGFREGDGPYLPFLLKVLAAASPLSLQAHPTIERARSGFAREDEEGVPGDAPHRNYKDELHKPELIYALSDRFDALCGFRDVDEVRAVVTALAESDERPGDGRRDLFDRILAELAPGEDAGTGLRAVFEWLSAGGDDVSALVERVVRAAKDVARGGRFERELAVVARLAETYPGDPGIVTSLLLNSVSLRRGEALYLPAGNIHAYLEGLGVELMAASDNVLRGGLTPKHVDVAELLEVLEFTPLPVPYLAPESPAPGVEVFRPDVPDFLLVRVSLDGATGAADVDIAGPAIAICTSGEVSMTGESSASSLARGESAYVTPDEGRLALSGQGEVFLATVGGIPAVGGQTPPRTITG
ncbi:mannose-6-phosphate isomerase, class I [Microbacteriaceae bacterium 4G12]